MSNALNDFLEARGDNLPRVADVRGGDGTPTTAADVIKNSPPNTLGNNSSQSTYQRVDWDVPVPVLALTGGSKTDQARSPTGYLEVLSITYTRGDPLNGILARNADGQMTNLVPRTLLGV